VYGSLASTVALSVAIASSELSSSRRYDSARATERSRSVVVWRRSVLDALRARRASMAQRAKKTTAVAIQITRLRSAIDASTSAASA
jgi:hypothetical protein